MLKSLYRYAVFNKVDNGIIVSLRQFHKKVEMQDYKFDNKNQKYSNDDENKLQKFRKWVAVSPEIKQPGFAFSVLNYNILSQQLLETHSYLYQEHSSNALRWNQRFYLLVGEILHNNPDILCCQVSFAQFVYTFLPLEIRVWISWHCECKKVDETGFDQNSEVYSHWSEPRL